MAQPSKVIEAVAQLSKVIETNGLGETNQGPRGETKQGLRGTQTDPTAMTGPEKPKERIHGIQIKTTAMIDPEEPGQQIRGTQTDTTTMLEESNGLGEQIHGAQTGTTTMTNHIIAPLTDLVVALHTEPTWPSCLMWFSGNVHMAVWAAAKGTQTH